MPVWATETEAINVSKILNMHGRPLTLKAPTTEEPKAQVAPEQPAVVEKPASMVERIARLLFPVRNPWPEKIPLSRHGVRPVTNIDLTWGDRVRVMIGGRIRVDTLVLWNDSYKRGQWVYSAVTIEPPAVARSADK
jgi:hypothetical protein